MLNAPPRIDTQPGSRGGARGGFRYGVTARPVLGTVVSQAPAEAVR